MFVEKRISIIQRVIPHYRIDFFNKVCKKAPNTIIYHSTEKFEDGLVETSTFPFPSENVYVVNNRYFYFQQVFGKAMRSQSDYIVLGLELKSLSNLLIWFASLFRQQNIIWWTHGYNVHLRKKGPLFFIDRVFKSLFMKRCHKILLYSKYNLHELITSGIQHSKVIILNNSLNEEPYQMAFKNTNLIDVEEIEARTKKSKHTITFIGRLTNNKNVTLILDITKRLIPKYPDIRVFIIGDGGERVALQRRAEEMDLKAFVYFLGTINDPGTLSPYMKVTDFIMHPGAVGLSVVHSMIYGIPFVTLRDAGHGPEIAYLRSDYNGYIAEDIEDLCGWMIDSYEKPEKMKRMKENCVLTIQKEVNMNSMVDNFLRAFD